MALYQLTLFYPSIKAHAATLTRIRSDVEAMSGKNWRVLSAGEQVCAIGFETDVPPEQIRTRLGNFDGIERFEFLLVEVAAVRGGFLGSDVWTWLARHRAQK